MDDESLKQLKDKLRVLRRQMQAYEDAVNRINSAIRHLPTQAQWFSEQEKSSTLLFLQAARLDLEDVDTSDIIKNIAETETAFKAAQVYVEKKRDEPAHATEETGVQSTPETETEGGQVLRSWTDVQESEGGINYEQYQDRLYEKSDPRGQYQRWRLEHGKYVYERTFFPNPEYRTKYVPTKAPKIRNETQPDFQHHASMHTLLHRMQELGCGE